MALSQLPAPLQFSLNCVVSQLWEVKSYYLLAVLLMLIFSALLNANSLQRYFISLEVGIFKAASQRASSLFYLFDGPGLIQAGFEAANGKPYEILSPDTRYVFVPSEEHIQEVDKAPDTVLSLQAASKQMLQPAYTMHGFNWFDRRGTEGIGFVRALRTLLTNNLPQILPNLSTITQARFQELHSQCPDFNGVKHVPIYPTITRIVVLCNAVSFFGQELAKNEPFMAAALAYIEETLLCAEVVKLLPKTVAPTVGNIISRFLKAHEEIYATLIPIAEQRCLERDLANLGHETPNHADCIQWIMNTAPKQKPWTAKRIVHELMAIWFGSVHALSTTITFAIQDLCLHPDYVDPLRRELETDYAEFERTGRGLALLDSFIKESARLTPVESMSMRRCATQPFALSDGTKLAVGDWACVPVRAIMQDPKYYPEPLNFNGFRFASREAVERIDTHSAFSNVSQPKPTELVDADQSFHVWGTGRMVCPGRYYAVAVMKVIVGSILRTYDCSLVAPNASRWFTWRSSMLPKKDTMVVFTPRP